MLKEWGKLLVVDLMRDELSLQLKDAADGPVPHKGGFKESELIKAFTEAGLDQIEFRPILEIGSTGKKVKLFIVSGVLQSGCI